MDYLTKRCQRPVPWNILYADDVALISDSVVDLQNDFNRWVKSLEENGLKISRKKTEHMSCIFDGSTQVNQIQLYIDGEPIPTVDHFKYLGSIISSDGGIERDVTHRTTTGWMKWRQLTGVMCDKRMPIRLKGKLYKTAIRPAILYGTECWASTKRHLSKLHVTEMRMLRWSAGVTLLDKVRNTHIRGSYKIAPIAEKVQERRLQWYGHVLRRPEDHMVRVALDLPTTSRRRGRPPATWLTTVQKDLKEMNVDVAIAQDRPRWRRQTRRADPR
uniref:Reverse transcriptase domain-containing protein n=1 Tax=Heliothis virescens TaxID=7102 RepID=A0A2A4JTH5_HELVI